MDLNMGVEKEKQKNKQQSADCIWYQKQHMQKHELPEDKNSVLVTAYPSAPYRMPRTEHLVNVCWINERKMELGGPGRLSG